MSEPITVAVIAAIGGLGAALIQTRRGNDKVHQRERALARAESSISDLRVKLSSQEATFKRKMERLEESYLRPVPIDKGEYRNSAMLIGLGNSGKTQLIKTMLGAGEADPNQKTMDYSIFKRKVAPGEAIFGGSSGSSNGNKHRITNLFVSDYRGQNIGNLVSSFIFQQKVQDSSMVYGFVNSLILIVDPVSVPTATAPNSEFDPERVEAHRTQWNRSAIDAVFGMLTADSLRYVCLFINKADVIRSMPEPLNDRVIIDEFAQLAELLGKRCPDEARFEIVYGSAKTGEGVQRVLDTLIETSVEDGKNVDGSQS